jgi:hypothetical protein
LRNRCWFSRAYEIAEDPIRKLLVAKTDQEPANRKVYPRAKLRRGPSPLPLKIIVFHEDGGNLRADGESKELTSQDTAE